MRRFAFSLTSGLILAFAALPLAADFVLYRVPGTPFMFALEGKATIDGRDRQVSYMHPGLKESITFPLADVEVLKASSNREQFNKQFVKAGKDAEAVYQAGVFGLKRGLLPEFYKAVDKTLEVDSQHAAATEVKKLKETIEKPLPDSAAVEKELREFCDHAGMEVAESAHFILLHDTGDSKSKKSRAQVRLALLEQVYESFLMIFYAQDISLDVPQQRLKVVLFKEYRDYLDFSRSISPELASASGYWDPIRNVSVFYDHSTDDVYRILNRMSRELSADAKEAKKARSKEGFRADRTARTIALMTQISQENADIKVVSHEATHQMAGNTGLFPRHVRIPSWAHEGLATWFESPREAGWSGVGAVNEERLEWYRGLEPDTQHSSIDFIVGDQIFKYAASHGALLHGYGQAWALTHFLMEKHLAKTVEYYRRLGELPPDTVVSPEVLTSLFDEVFGEDRKKLDAEWRSHMRSLKPDLQKLREEQREKEDDDRRR